MCLQVLGVLILLYLGYKLLDRLLRLGHISNLGDRYILITGCDTGFGFEIARRLDKLGCHVFAGCLTEQGEEDVSARMSERMKTVHLDVSNHDSVTRAYDTVKSLLPPDTGLWGVLNNAGVFGAMGPCEWHSVQQYIDTLKVNTLGLIDVTITFMPLVKKAKGRVVNTSSEAGRFASAGLSIYCMSKFAVEAFSDSLRREMKAFGVSVHLIEPSSFKTNITKEEALKANMKMAWDRVPDHVKKTYRPDYAANRLEFLVQFINTKASSDLTPVIDAYEHALVGNRPRKRYVVGLEARALCFLHSLPECISDALFTRTSSPLPADYKP